MILLRISSCLRRKFAVRCNAYVEETAPWKLAKDESQSAKLDEVLYSLAESLRILSILLEPMVPEQAASMRAQLNWTEAPSVSGTRWGLLPCGHQLADPVPLFPRIEAQP
jgi:methionyl-tRNA synthetase